MTLTLRIQHSSGMKRINIENIEDKFNFINQQIKEKFNISESQQLLSTTPLNNPNFIDPSNYNKKINSFNFSNGQILHLMSLENDEKSNNSKNQSEDQFKMTEKCKHSLKGRCLHCCYSPKGAGNKIKGKCLHGPNATCTNCNIFVNNKEQKSQIKCLHDSEGFCNNCLPSQKFKNKKEEIENLKKLHCKCKDKTQKCIYCCTDEVNDSHIYSYQEFLHKRQIECNHVKDSYDSSTDSCALCAKKPRLKFRLKSCTQHKPWPAGICSKCMPPNAVIKLQNYRHCDQLSVIAFAPLQRFVSSWTANPSKPKACFLVGNYQNINRKIRANVHAIFVPEQKSDQFGVEFLPDKRMEILKKILKALNLNIVGWAITTLPRGGEKYFGELFMSSREIKQAAKFQSEFSDSFGHSKFVTMIVGYNDQGQIEPKCYQVSDQCVSLEEENFLSNTDDIGFLSINPNLKNTKTKYIPTVIYKNCDLKKGEKFIPDEFLVKVTSMQPSKPKQHFLRAEFPEVGGSEEDFKKTLNRLIELPYHKKFSDFSLLLWASKLLGEEKTVELAKCVSEGKETSHTLGQEMDMVLAEYFS